MISEAREAPLVAGTVSVYFRTFTPKAASIWRPMTHHSDTRMVRPATFHATPHALRHVASRATSTAYGSHRAGAIPQ